tara:strand:- start:18 stop:368 length:351 start_codon:yes stop_codon:yes gene_type:complete
MSKTVKYNRNARKMIMGILLGLLIMTLLLKMSAPLDHRMVYLGENNADALNMAGYGLDNNNKQLESQFGIPMFEKKSDEKGDAQQNDTEIVLKVPDMAKVNEWGLWAKDKLSGLWA